MKCSIITDTISKWMPASSFAILFGATGNLLIHEAGHVVAAAYVYKDLSAQIRITGLFKAATSWSSTGLTPFGTFLGDLNSRLLVCVAGPLTAILAGAGALVVSKMLFNRYPELSRYLAASAIVTIAYQILYALSALWTSQTDLGHDFVMLWHVGVNPVVAGICLASIPTIALAAYFRLKKSHSGHNQ